MKKALKQRGIALPAALLLAMLLCVQTLEVSHFHADNSAAHDCLQHQVDTSYAAHAVHSADPVAWTEAAVSIPVNAQFAFTTHFDLAARGPPALSC